MTLALYSLQHFALFRFALNQRFFIDTTCVVQNQTGFRTREGVNVSLFRKITLHCLTFILLFLTLTPVRAQEKRQPEVQIMVASQDAQGGY